MQENVDLLKYFIDEVNRRHEENRVRFDKVDEKLDSLISFRMMLLGGAFVISCIASLIVSIVFSG